MNFKILIRLQIKIIVKAKIFEKMRTTSNLQTKTIKGQKKLFINKTIVLIFLI